MWCVADICNYLTISYYYMRHIFAKEFLDLNLRVLIKAVINKAPNFT